MVKQKALHLLGWGKLILLHVMLAMSHLRMLFLLGILLPSLLTGCQKEALIYNQWECALGEQGNGFLSMKMEGEEEQLGGFLAELQVQLGVAKVTFLHYTLENYDEFFQPKGRALDPKNFASPYGYQKIMVWQGLRWPALTQDLIEVSLQIEERRRGHRPIDLYDCELALRVRSSGKEDLLGNCGKRNPVKNLVKRMSALRIGPPHGKQENPEFEKLAEYYVSKQKEYAERVAGILDPDCYPPLSQRSNGFGLRICEIDGMVDTLHTKVEVLDAGGDRLRYFLYDVVGGKPAEEILIMDGMSGYNLLVKDAGEVAEIRFILPGGRVVIYYDKEDFLDNNSHKQRDAKDFYRRKREERIQEQVKENQEVNA
ncbi:MAG TPA: hypothetical protein ENJ82_02575 [Bacteroidetes bacterium]|nr:hypothetical protein [Bacteroidota bacterium]